MLTVWNSAVYYFLIARNVHLVRKTIIFFNSIDTYNLSDIIDSCQQKTVKTLKEKILVSVKFIFAFLTLSII